MATLVREDVAIFPGIDLGTIHALGLPTKDLRGVTNAFDIIAGYKVGSLDTASARVPPIGAGNTAIDNAVAAVRLGAQGGQEVTMVCRRSPAQMSTFTFTFEDEHVRREDVRFLWNLQPTAIHGAAKAWEA